MKSLVMLRHVMAVMDALYLNIYIYLRVSHHISCNLFNLTVLEE